MKKFILLFSHTLTTAQTEDGVVKKYSEFKHEFFREYK